MIVALLATAAFSAAARAEPKTGEPAPPLSVEQLLNAPKGASARWVDLKGKVVVVEFWATWCAPCIASIPHLNELAERFKDKDVVFISLTDEPGTKVEPFLKRKPIRGWVALDTDQQAGEAYGVTDIPRTFIVGRDGKILGDTHPAELSAAHIDNALRGEPLGLPSPDRDTRRDATVPATPRKPVYGDSFAIGRFPPIGSDNDGIPAPLAQVIVRPALDPDGVSKAGGGKNRRTWINADPASVVRAAYGEVYHTRVDLKATLPKQNLDVAIWAPPGDSRSYRRLVDAGLGAAFGLSAHVEGREVDVLLLKVADGATPRLTPTASTGGSMASTRTEQDGEIASYINLRADGLADTFESRLDIPVLNETGLTEGYDVELVMPRNIGEAREVLRPLGLSLVPARRRLTYVVVENAPNN